MSASHTNYTQRRLAQGFKACNARIMPVGFAAEQFAWLKTKAAANRWSFARTVRYYVAIGIDKEGE